MTRQAGALIGLTAVVSFLLGLVSAGTRPVRSPYRVAAATAESPAPIAASAAPVIDTAPTLTGVDFAAVAAQLNAAVVNVDNASRGAVDRGRPFPPRFRREFGDDSNAPRSGSGSGFIIDPTGYILTNYHVVEGADRLTVTLGDGRAFRATVVGIDPAIDVALLRIPAREPLPVAPLGRSETLRVGEWVCAIGNPLGYVHSVTVGVVSFLGRKIFDRSLDALIQTDAAITFGNSGGPLINSRGEVVGMATAISTAASNIGFAIPIDQIVAVLPQLQEHGRVSRGFLGVGLTGVTPALQRALRLGTNRGAVVQDVSPSTPADRAGLRTYDVIIAADGRSIRSDEDLIRYISGRQPGVIAMIEIWRDGATRVVPVKLTERPVPASARSGSEDPSEVQPAAAPDQGPLGLTVRDLDEAVLARFQRPDTIHGVVVSRVDQAGPARVADIQPGQVVLEVNRQRVTSAAEFRAMVAALPSGEPVALLMFDRAADQRLIVTVIPDGLP
jgi:serine protease Do